jgi:hypothetical protein
LAPLLTVIYLAYSMSKNHQKDNVHHITCNLFDTNKALTKLEKTRGNRQQRGKTSMISTDINIPTAGAFVDSRLSVHREHNI